MARCLLVLVLCAAGPLAGADDDPYSRLVEWLGGRWDNRQQAQDDGASGIDAFDRHPHRALTFVPVKAPAMNGQLFAVRVHDDNGFAGPFTRVSLQRLVPSKVTTEIIQEFLFLSDPSAWGDLGASLASLGRLHEADVRVNPKCRMYWRWVGDHFEGRTREGRCVTSSASGDEMLVESFGALYQDRLVRHDLNYALDGTLQSRQGGKTPEIFDRR